MEGRPRRTPARKEWKRGERAVGVLPGNGPANAFWEDCERREMWMWPLEPGRSLWGWVG
jgi:hypothetical protein